LVFIRPFLYFSGLFVQPVVLSVAWKEGDTMTTLENLYYGNITPHEYDVTAKLVIRHEQELFATLTEQQKAILEKSRTITQNL